MNEPSQAENNAWFSYRATAAKQNREVDERTFRDAWRQGCRFTFGATSQLSPAIATFIDWMNYVTDWAPPPAPAQEAQPAEAQPAEAQPTEAES